MPISTITALFPHPQKSVTGDEIAAYTAGQDIPSSVRGIKIWGVTGELVNQWEFLVDGGQILNVNNEPVHPDEVWEALDQLSTEELIVALEDYMGSADKSSVDNYNVKIELIEGMKPDPAALILRIVIREVV